MTNEHDSDPLDYRGDPHAETLHNLKEFAHFAAALGVVVGIIVFVVFTVLLLTSL